MLFGKLKERTIEIKPCISCQTACLTMSKSNGTNNTQTMDDSTNMCRCALNPETMQSSKYYIKEARVKRPRIQKETNPKKVVITLGGSWTVTMSFEEYKKHGDGLKIVMKIY